MVHRRRCCALDESTRLLETKGALRVLVEEATSYAKAHEEMGNRTVAVAMMHAAEQS